MPFYHYLIIGGGMSADAAARGIRKVDARGSIGLIGAEPDPPYNRPPLSKGLWKGRPLERIWRRTETLGVTLHLTRSARDLDPGRKRVLDDQGTEYRYDKLLLATGGRPRRLPFGGDEVIYFRDLNDYRRLRELAESRQRFAVIGGGFIGSEIAAALAMNGKRVTLLFPESGLGARTFPEDLTRFLNDYYRAQGVEVRPDTRVVGLERHTEAVTLHTHDGGTLEADGVVAGIGIMPNVELAQAAGLAVDNGIVVDGALRTSQPDVYAAGDVAAFHNPALDKRLRVEHEDNANQMGELAGRSMAGEVVRYDHLPYFYSDLFDLGYEAVGELDPTLETVADWREPYRTGVIHYLREGRVRGVLLWNVWKHTDAARALITQPGPYTAGDLIGRITG
ncbi:MAG: FAD-dependent oxidoreductase [Gammaproteobacteria bacterium]|nr:FAD-dependent oxidoreductase [Gammaproteobacteria bacterium]